MNIAVNIPDKRIRELIEGAGSGGWAANLELERTSLAFSIVEIDEDPPVEHNVTEAQVKKGLEKMAAADANEGGWHFGCVLDWRKSDMYTGDAVIQFAVFGELKYV